MNTKKLLTPRCMAFRYYRSGAYACHNKVKPGKKYCRKHEKREEKVNSNE